MAASEPFRRHAALRIQTIPFMAEEGCFDLKSGTAINLFVHDMPRPSVDIGLTCLPVKNRGASLAEIRPAMKPIGERIAGKLRGARRKNDESLLRVCAGRLVSARQRGFTPPLPGSWSRWRRTGCWYARLAHDARWARLRESYHLIGPRLKLQLIPRSPRRETKRPSS